VRLSQILFSQGFGARRACEGLVAGGCVSIGGVVIGWISHVDMRGDSWFVPGFGFGT